MAPWTREMVEVRRRVALGLYYVKRDESLVLDWVCEVRRSEQLRTG